MNSCLVALEEWIKINCMKEEKFAERFSSLFDVTKVI
jgi:hypothetical protein